MHKIAAAVLVFWSSLASATVLNVEFKFTPYTGDPKQDQVQTVAGRAKVFVNGALIAEQEVRQDTVPVLFDDREIGPAVWLPTASLGPVLRKGKNVARFEFVPSDAKAPYHAQLSWASVTDQTTEGQSESGATTSTNQSGEGQETKDAKGKLTLEREFVADFAADLPWHHYPATTALDDADKQQLAAVVTARAPFKPGFADVYQSLEGKEGIEVGEIKKAKCLDAAYAAGIRVVPPSADQLDFVLTGNPEVVVQRKGGALYELGSPDAFARIKGGDEQQMCAGVALSLAYPPHLAFVRTPAGAWEVVY